VANESVESIIDAGRNVDIAGLRNLTRSVASVSQNLLVMLQTQSPETERARLGIGQDCTTIKQIQKQTQERVDECVKSLNNTVKKAAKENQTFITKINDDLQTEVLMIDTSADKALLQEAEDAISRSTLFLTSQKQQFDRER
jgi:vacuolar-type H+-ATPase subunit H